MDNHTEAEKKEATDFEALFTTEQKRRRGLQSENDRLKHSQKLLEKKLESMSAGVGPQLTKEQTEELDNLKFSDPDAYYSKRQSMEQASAKERAAMLAKIEDEVVKEVEKEEMGRQLVDASKTLSEKIEGFRDVVSPDKVKDFVPPKITKKFEDKKLSAEEYLELAYKYIQAELIPEQAPTKVTPNLGDVAGGQQASEEAVNAELETSYDKVVF